MQHAWGYEIGKTQIEDLGIDRRIISNWILEKSGAKLGARLNWFSISSNGRVF